MVQLKGNLNIMISQYYREPKMFEKENDDGKIVEIKHFEIGYRKVVPPTVIEIKANDNNSNIPFWNEWLYMTIECGDYNLIDDIELIIRACPYVNKNRKIDKNRPSNQTAEKERQDELLYDDQKLEKKLREEKKQSLIEFRNMVRDQVKQFMEFRGDFHEFYQEILKLKELKQNYRNASNLFLTNVQMGDEEDYETLKFFENKMEQYLQMALESGDFIRANTLAA